MLREVGRIVRRGDSTWPEEQFEVLNDAGVLRWCIPVEWGGRGLDPAELLDGHSADRRRPVCLPLVLTQHAGALPSGLPTLQNQAAKDEFLHRLWLAASVFAHRSWDFTAPLVVVRQHCTCRPYAGGGAGRRVAFVLGSGRFPGSQGADHADFLVTGGTLPDGRRRCWS